MHPSEKSPKVAAQKAAHTTEKHADGAVEGADPRAHANHILGGYKSVLQNPNAPEYSKQHAREVLLMEGADDVASEPDSQRAPNPNASF
ncbi:hypothetical protein CYLTODRAFT_424761 [Cylindrobasidium torrendii FP15055 ss-10]|uniref:Conidiation-specific protein 6 n=1 Tax=Cylindrobasidium torrendii FP15055 ss-10 TaxID=1314674 RepID=A0A0D7B2Y2_9AGAR|nr:hypothetical protein CYLTODRAFT_424761 [Cylindrobasidium torrendii FP15055 ss-10]